MKLYNYYRSSASYRVRIALHMKGLEYEYAPVHLINNGGEQFKPEYLAKNPMAQIPCLEHKGQLISQSMAILIYLEDLQPNPRLFPADAGKKAKVVEVCELINSGIQPLQNPAVVNEIGRRYSVDKSGQNEWIHHWINKGLSALEKVLSPHAGTFCVGNEVTAADCFLIPQMFASRRMGVDLNAYPLLLKIEKAALALPAFEKAHPSQQVDYTP